MVKGDVVPLQYVPMRALFKVGASIEAEAPFLASQDEPDTWSSPLWK